MFIDFEGIDGSGKTTLSNRVSARLRKAGYRVAHAREGGELQAPIARRIRELTRDAGLLEMSARTEFFLNLARESQQLDQVVKPALERGELCITDRYLYSHLALTGAGRGLGEEALAPAAELASQGIWPDLVILVDVDPDLARLRKKLGKLLAKKRSAGESRKGLTGAGLAARVRQGFLELARREPARWLVIENDDQPLWLLEQRIFEAVVSRLEGRESRVQPVLPQGPRRPGVGLEAVEDRFFAALQALEDREPALCAYLLTGIWGPRAHQRRLGYAEALPALVARSLSGVVDEDAFRARALLAERAPAEVAASLGSDPSDQAMGLREALFARAPAEVTSGLKGNATVRAWELRERSWEGGLWEPVMMGLAAVDEPRAWQMRESALEAGLAVPVARSLIGVEGQRADALREQLWAVDRLAVLRSLTGSQSALSRRLRAELLDRATKGVMRSLAGVQAGWAYELRERVAPHSKEALDSIDGLDDPRAWALRERCAGLWPATALSSLRHLAAAPRGQALLARVLQKEGGRLPVLRNAYAQLANAAHRGQERVSWRAPCALGPELAGGAT